MAEPIKVDIGWHTAPTLRRIFLSGFCTKESTASSFQLKRLSKCITLAKFESYSFKATDGWLQKFMSHHSLTLCAKTLIVRNCLPIFKRSRQDFNMKSTFSLATWMRLPSTLIWLQWSCITYRNNRGREKSLYNGIGMHSLSWTSTNSHF